MSAIALPIEDELHPAHELALKMLLAGEYQPLGTRRVSLRVTHNP